MMFQRFKRDMSSGCVFVVDGVGGGRGREAEYVNNV